MRKRPFILFPALAASSLAQAAAPAAPGGSTVRCTVTASQRSHGAAAHHVHCPPGALPGGAQPAPAVPGEAVKAPEPVRPVPRAAI